MVKSRTRSITQQILNSETGELENKIFNEDLSYTKTFKQGWRMYYKDYDEMLEKSIRSSKDVKTLHHIKELINKEFELHLNITKEANQLNIGRNKLSVFISRLVENGFLFRTEVGFKSNPFMYIPYRAIDILQKQEEWKSLHLEKEKNEQDS
jgi:hypothetical protein